MFSLYDPSQEHLLLKLDPQDFQKLRRKNIINYKLLCKRLQNLGNKDLIMKLAQTILKRPQVERLEEEICLLQKASENFQFFKELNSKPKNIERKLHYQCCQRMTYRFYKQGDIVFKFDDPPDQFFIILDGSVNVFIPKDPEKVKHEAHLSKQLFQSLKDKEKNNHPISLIVQAKRRRLKLKITMPFHLIRILKQKTQQREDQLEINELLGFEEQQSNQNISIDNNHFSSERQINLDKKIINFNSSTLIEYKSQQSINTLLSQKSIDIDLSQKTILQKIKQEVKEQEDAGSKGREESLKLLLEQTGGIQPQTISDLDYVFQDGVFKHRLVATLTKGMMFGELGILMNKPRSATIIACQSTNVAVLQSADYKSILKEAELHKIDVRITFFMNHFFTSLPKNTVLRYSYFLKKKKYQRGNHLYHEGDKADFVYLIRKGDLLVYTKQPNQKTLQTKRLKLTHVNSADELLKQSKQTCELEVQKEQLQKLNICYLSNGEIFGESEVMFGTKRRNFIEVTSNQATIYQISSNQFKKILDENYNLQNIFKERVKMKLDWEMQKLQELNQFEKTKNSKPFNKLQSTVNSPVQKSNQNVSQSWSLPIKQQANPDQLNSTKFVVNQLNKQVKEKQKFIRNHFQKEDQYETTQGFQRDLLLIQQQNIQLNQMKRKTNILIPQQELEKMKKSGQIFQNIRNTILTSSQKHKEDEFVDLKDVINYKSLKIPKSCTSQCKEDLINTEDNRYGLNSQQKYFLRKMNFNLNQPSQTEQDSLQVKSYTNLTLSTSQNNLLTDLSSRIKTNQSENQFDDVQQKKNMDKYHIIKKQRAQSIINSKHNQFRPKPQKSYLLTKYQNQYDKVTLPQSQVQYFYLSGTIQKL